MRNVFIIVLIVVVVALPFVFRVEEEQTGWQPGDPELVIISPHNEAIRYEFGNAFSAWHKASYGRPVRVDWRVIGGTTEIMRYLAAEYVSAFRAWWRAQQRTWPPGGDELILDRRFNAETVPGDIHEEVEKRRRRELKRTLHEAFRATDDPDAFTCKIDLFFGGGVYDHRKAAAQGLTVAAWDEDKVPAGIFTSSTGRTIIPEQLGGETWRTDTFFGAALSTFGICYNTDRIEDLGLAHAPRRWVDLTDPAYFRQVGVADPTKSGSIAKAFEMVIHEQCLRATREAGFSEEQVDAYEASIEVAGLPLGALPVEVPVEYQEAIERGWLQGLRLIQKIGANSRYFTDSAGKVPLDVAAGNAAAGVAIDFFGRFQAEVSRGPGGTARMVYVTPVGGSSVSADPISLLRGAENKELALRFMTFVLSEEGQKLWNYAPDTPGGPKKFALRRLPIRSDFYPAAAEFAESKHAAHAPHCVDALGQEDVNPYALAGKFVYRPRWTSRHFNVHRDVIRAMCLDAGEELREAWRVILSNGGPQTQPRAVALLERMPDWPEHLSWRSALSVSRNHSRLDYMREWTIFFRRSYREAARAVEEVNGER